MTKDKAIALHVTGVNLFPNHQSVSSISFSPFRIEFPSTKYR